MCTALGLASRHTGRQTVGTSVFQLQLKFGALVPLSLIATCFCICRWFSDINISQNNRGDACKFNYYFVGNLLLNVKMKEYY